MIKIGLISDTHGVFSDEFRKFLDPVDQLWHAGDWGGDMDFVQSIADFKPVTGVCGNCDSRDLRYTYPVEQFFDCGGASVLMTHIGGSPGHYYDGARRMIEVARPSVFVCGHSHILKVQFDQHYNMLYINPGACGLQGWQTVRTALRFGIEAGEVRDMEVLNIPR